MATSGSGTPRRSSAPSTVSCSIHLYRANTGYGDDGRPVPLDVNAVLAAVHCRALDLSVLEHHTFPLSRVNDALDDLPDRHGGFTNFLVLP